MNTAARKTAPSSSYGEAPLGVECAFPGSTPRLASTGLAGTSLWRRMVYRFKYGIRVTPAGRVYRTS